MTNSDTKCGVKWGMIWYVRVWSKCRECFWYLIGSYPFLNLFGYQFVLYFDLEENESWIWSRILDTFFFGKFPDTHYSPTRLYIHLHIVGGYGMYGKKKP